MRARTRLVIDLALAGSLLGAPAVAATRFAPTLEAARKESLKTGRPMLLVYGTSWCGWCRKMERETLSDPSFAARSETDFVVVKVDAEDGGPGTAFARLHRVRSFPTLVLADAAGKQIARLSGFRTADALLRDLSLARVAEPVPQGATPRDPKAIAAAALELERTSQDEEARAAWASLVEVPGLHPATRELALWRIVALAGSAGDHCAKVEALVTLARDHTRGPRLEEALHELGETHALMGNRDDAVAAYQQQLARFPAGRYASAAAGGLARLGAAPSPSF